MRSLQLIIGDCPTCGDNLYVFLTNSHKRLAKCINEHCPKQTAYGLPHAGALDPMDAVCPQSQLPIIRVTPKLFLQKGFIKKQTRQAYYFTNKPCFTCPANSKCPALLELGPCYEADADDE